MCSAQDEHSASISEVRWLLLPTCWLSGSGTDTVTLDSIINRLQIGDCCLTHSYCVVKIHQPVSTVDSHWQWNTVECTNLQAICEKYFSVLSVRDLFESIDNHLIVGFIKENHFITSYNVCYFNFILALQPWFLLFKFYYLLAITWFNSYSPT